MKKANIFLPVLLLLCMVTSLICSCSNNTAIYYADYTPLSDIIPKIPNEPDTDFYITTTAAKSKFLMSSMYYVDGETDNYSGVFFRTNESIAEDLAASENRLAEAEKELDSALKAEDPDRIASLREEIDILTSEVDLLSSTKSDLKSPYYATQFTIIDDDSVTTIAPVNDAGQPLYLETYGCDILGDGRIAVLTQYGEDKCTEEEQKERHSGGAFHNYYELCVIGTDGGIDASLPVVGIGDGFFSTGVDVDMKTSGDHVCLLYGDSLAALDDNLNVIWSGTLSELFPDFADRSANSPELIEAGNGDVYLSYYKTNGVETDRLAVRLGDTIETSEKLTMINAYTVMIGGDGTAYARDSAGIDTLGKDGNKRRLFNWMDIDLAADMIRDISVVSDSGIYLTVNYGSAFEDFSKMMFVKVTSGQKRPTTRKELTIAYDATSGGYDTQNIQRYISSFNLTSKDYRVVARPYETDDVSTASEKLSRDLVSGKMPDMVVFAGGIKAGDFMRYDCFKDLYELIDDSVGREYFAPCVLEPFEYDGKLPYLALEYEFGMLVTTDEDIADAANRDDVSAAFEIMNEAAKEKGIPFFGTYGDTETSGREKLLSELLDCYPSDGDFRDLIGFCGDVNIVEAKSGKFGQDYLVIKETFDSMVYMALRSVLTVGDGTVTFGLPSENGFGYSVSASTGIGLTKRGDSDSSWEFVLHCLEEQSDDWKTSADKAGDRFPAARGAADIMLDTLENMVVISDGSIRCVKRNSYDDITMRRAVSEKKKPLTARIVPDTDDIRLMKNLVYNRVRLNPVRIDGAVKDIVLEEASAYFFGAQTLDRTAEIISDRVKTRLSE